MKIKSIASVMLLACAIAFTNCSKSTTEDISPVNTPKDDDTPTDTTSKVTYKSNIKAIMDSNCVSCHGSTAPKAGISLVTYNQVKSSAQNGNLINAMKGANGISVMPPSGKLAKATLDLIDQWKTDGFLEQ